MIAATCIEFRELNLVEIVSSTLPAREIDQAKLEALARSLRAAKLLQRVIVRPAGDAFELIAGERRLRAARLAGWKTIPAEIRHGIDQADSLALALLENALHETLPPMAVARGLQSLLAAGGNAAKLSRLFGEHPKWAGGMVDLLGLPAEWQAEIDAGTLPLHSAAKLVKLADRPGVLAAIAEARRLNPSQFSEECFGESVDFVVRMFDEIDAAQPVAAAATVDDTRAARRAQQRDKRRALTAVGAAKLLERFANSRVALVAIRDQAAALLAQLESVGV